MRMIPKYKRLKVELGANDIDQRTLCKEIGRSPTYLSVRLRGKAPFNMDDVYAICDYLHIQYGEIPVYFPRDGVEADAANNTIR